MTERDIEEIVDDAITHNRNVKDILVDMKDTSELMVDLAYSALLANSKEIAVEVGDLEERMDELTYEIASMLMLSARTPEEAADLTGILYVAHAAEQISDAADSIAEIVARGVGDHPIYKTFLDEAEEQVVKVLVNKGSELIGNSLGELQIKKEIDSGG